MKAKFISSLDNITNPEIKAIALNALNNLPEHFWTQPSSVSGKHHPADEHETGGLALHTLRVMEAAEILIEAHPSPLYVDAVRLAAMLHDAGRYGLNKTPADHTLDNHPEIGVTFLSKLIPSPSPNWGKVDYTTTLAVACEAIKTHMGRWGKHKPYKPEHWLVHYADIIAAQYMPSKIFPTPIITKTRAEEAVPITNCSGKVYTPEEREDLIRYILLGAEIQWSQR